MLAKKLNIEITGTLGTLIKARQQNIIPMVKPILEKLREVNPHCASTRRNACIHNAVGLSEFLFVYYRFYFGEGSLLDAKGVKQLL